MFFFAFFVLIFLHFFFVFLFFLNANRHRIGLIDSNHASNANSPNGTGNENVNKISKNNHSNSTCPGNIKHAEINKSIKKDDKNKNENNNNIKKAIGRKKHLVVVGHHKICSHEAFTMVSCELARVKRINWKLFDVAVFIVKEKERMYSIVKQARKKNEQLFICVVDVDASESAKFRCVKFV